MSELLFLGYNVAVPEVDVGDDIFVVDDSNGNLSRVQVKTAEKITKTRYGRVAQYNLSSEQLKLEKNTELYYVFVRRLQASWEFVVLSRPDLLDLRERFEKAEKKKARTTEMLTLRMTFGVQSVTVWEESVQPYRGDFERYFPRLPR
jgi:hypothetical protein